jgi:hypothetical protein
MNKINLDDLTIAQAKELAATFTAHCNLVSDTPATPCNSWQIGKIYLIRTVTMIDTGKLVAFNTYELVLEDAAWIADTGRFADAVKKAEFNEVEPFPAGRVIIGRGAIIDAVEIIKAPRSQK